MDFLIKFIFILEITTNCQKLIKAKKIFLTPMALPDMPIIANWVILNANNIEIIVANTVYSLLCKSLYGGLFLYASIMGINNLFDHFFGLTRTIEYRFIEVNSASITLLLAIITLIAFFMSYNNKCMRFCTKMISLPLAFILLAKSFTFYIKWKNLVLKEMKSFFKGLGPLNPEQAFMILFFILGIFFTIITLLDGFNWSKIFLDMLIVTIDSAIAPYLHYSIHFWDYQFSYSITRLRNLNLYILNSSVTGFIAFTWHLLIIFIAYKYISLIAIRLYNIYFPYEDDESIKLN